MFGSTENLKCIIKLVHHRTHILMIYHFHIKLKERTVEADNRKSLIVSLFAVLACVIVIFAAVIYTQDLFKQ